MPLSLSTLEPILDTIRRKPGCEIEDLLKECPGLTWNQVFLALDRLSRDGAVRLMRKDRGKYFVMPVNHERTEGGCITTAH
jgi:uncharacterized membrane protein